MPWMASVSAGLWVGVGSRYEPAALNGICHFIEHLLFKGTTSRSAHEISQAIEGIGGYLNAFTSEELTCFHARAGYDHLEVLLDVLMDMLLRPCLRASDISKEREVIKEEIAMYLDEPQHQVQELLNAALWPNHPLGRPITGTPESLDGLHRGQIRKYWAHNYVATNSVLVVAGRLKHSHVLRSAAKYLRCFGAGSKPTFANAQTGQLRPSCGLITKNTEQTQIAMGIRTCPRFDPRRYAVRLLNTILGENMSSRLFQVIREDRGLAYSIYTSPSFFADDGDLVVSAGLDTSNLERVLRLVLCELKKLSDCLVPAAELRRAQDYVIGQMNLSLEGTEAQMNWVGEQLLGYGRILSPQTVQKGIAKVTGKDVRDAARAFFRPERFNLAVVSPRKEIRSVEKLLLRFT